MRATVARIARRLDSDDGLADRIPPPPGGSGAGSFIFAERTSFRRSPEALYGGCPGNRTMVINARGISGSDPGAVPGGSTKLLVGDHGAETGSTDV